MIVLNATVRPVEFSSSRYRTEKESAMEQCREELVRLYSVNRSLCGVVADLEEGRYAVKFSSGIKKAVLPDGVVKEVVTARSSLDEERFPILFEETRRLQRALRRYSSEQKLTPHGGT